MTRAASFSITVRLSLMFAAVSAAMLVGVGIYLYQALDRENMQHYVKELVVKLSVVRHVLSEARSPDEVVAESHRFAEALVGHGPLHLTLIGADGRVLFASNTFRVPAELLTEPVPPDEVPSITRLWEEAPGEAYLTVAALGRLGGDPKPPVLISLAVGVGDHHLLVSRYRTNTIFAVSAGILLAALLGWLVASRSLRPVRQIAVSAANITASELGRRLDERSAPTELAQLVSAFNGMLARLEQSFRHLEDFSSDLAHELRTPINNLMGQAQVALSRARTPEQYRELLASSLEEYGRLSRMISDMLFLAKADQRQLPFNREKVDVRPEIEKVLEFYEALLEDRGIQVSLRGEATVSADRILLQRAITNLLSNAVRHTQRGDSIGIGMAQDSDGAVSVEVCNPGPGIAPEHLPRIFDRFYRIDRARTLSQESSGLGLAIVKSIMRLHGGEVSVSSGPGGVTRFFLVFPLHASGWGTPGAQ